MNRHNIKSCVYTLLLIIVITAVTGFIVPAYADNGLPADTEQPKQTETEKTADAGENVQDNAVSAQTDTKRADMAQRSPNYNTSAQSSKNNDNNTRKSYAPSVLKALKYMKTAPDSLKKWAENTEGTQIRKLVRLPENKQRIVARIACYIHKCNKKLPIKTVWREACAIYCYSVKYGLSPDLVAAVAKLESNYYPHCVSRHGACGVMQVIYRIHHARLAKHGITKTKEDIFDPEKGVHAGVLILRGYVDASGGSLYKGIMKYLGGHSDKYYAALQNTVTKIRKTGEDLYL